MFDLLTQDHPLPRIAVFGVGGCGCNTINQLAASPLSDNVQLVAVNTDAQSLAASQCNTRLQIGLETTKGLGAGAKPEKGHEAAQESAAQLKELITFADIIFITGGMGGGTGTGAIPFIASIATELNKPLVAVVTTPFSFEGHQRNRLANNGVEQLMQQANAVIVLPNDKLIETLEKKISLLNAFFESNRILQDVLLGLTTTISQSGLINIDLNDFIAVVSHQGRAAMGVAKQEKGEDLQVTINNALKNPLLEEVDLTHAKGAIVSVMATEDIELSQYNSIGASIQQQLDPSALVIIGLTIVPELECELELMIIATGIQAPSAHNAILADATTIPPKKDRFNSLELVNVSDLLKAKSRDGRNDPSYETELDIPTYTRQNNLAKGL
ncbi:cell division protein FtsZ [Shewanella youngdeokensis]|uniref:Cell division protein FtsZ n=1 Tax=Shewanella youngdeokensis TaxID=2999068 RepID=A0ABZ0JXZ5_9GAMM|nr:cell division protein FtsZ [Shewanella sp. DAU334]